MKFLDTGIFDVKLYDFENKKDIFQSRDLLDVRDRPNFLGLFNFLYDRKATPYLIAPQNSEANLFYGSELKETIYCLATIESPTFDEVKALAKAIETGQKDSTILQDKYECEILELQKKEGYVTYLPVNIIPKNSKLSTKKKKASFSLFLTSKELFDEANEEGDSEGK